MMKKNATIVSGYFNPLHKGHIEYINTAKFSTDILFVIINNDLQRELKGSKEFQNETERLLIISNLKAVDYALISIDKDRSVCKTIAHIFENYNHKFCFSFANGGDQDNNSIPETSVCEALGIELLDGLGDKIQSSSWLLKK
jgi:D-beta-D-heptose 7-phosphate kinase/D-beta-D-heptose 1-phosphate adenosyltransferase